MTAAPTHSDFRNMHKINIDKIWHASNSIGTALEALCDLTNKGSNSLAFVIEDIYLRKAIYVISTAYNYLYNHIFQRHLHFERFFLLENATLSRAT